MKTIPAKITPFDFAGKIVRVLIDDSGEPWWVGSEVCNCLGLYARDSIRYLDDDEKSKVSRTVLGLDPGKKMILINEPGLYSLVMKSRKDKSRKFKRWITHDILPIVRKTGSYSINQPDLPTTKLGWMELAVENEKEKIKAIEKADTFEKQNKKLLPKADALDQIAGGNGLLSFTQAAKNLGIKPKGLIDILLVHKVIYRTKDKKVLMPIQYYLDHGWFKVKMTGPNAEWPQTMVTNLGLTKLGTRFSRFYEKEN